MILGGARIDPKRRFATSLAALLPDDNEVVGWMVTHKPIAETAEMKRAVGELLNYDDAIFAIYSASGIRVSIYAAYWSPGKMSHRLIATHTPDVCWVGGGWQRLQQGVEQWVFAMEEKPLRLEHRIFALNGQVEHVVFCHLVGGKPMIYKTAAKPPWYAMFTDLRLKGLRQREEQIFFRISSDRPFAEFRKVAPVAQFFGRLGVELSAMGRAEVRSPR